MDVLEEALRVFNILCAGMGLIINARKTKVLAVCPGCTHRVSVQLEDGEEHLEMVRELDCLGT